MSDKVLTVLRDFDPTKDAHVEWLKAMTRAAPEEYVKILRESPVSSDINAKDVVHWAQLHMCLCAKYVKHLFTH